MITEFIRKFRGLRRSIEDLKKKNTVIVVGSESTMDVWLTYRNLEHIRTFIGNYSGVLKNEMFSAYNILSEGKGDELAIDGEIKDYETLFMDLLKEKVIIEYALGGNGALEASALSALGADTVFAGRIFPEQLETLPEATKKYFRRVNFKYAEAVRDSYPVSLIIQTSGGDRVILCDGDGRRWNHIKDYIISLPERLREIYSDMHVIHSLNLVGWHVLFAKKTEASALELVHDIVRDSGRYSHITFTDCGALTKISRDTRKKLFKYVYDSFDILSVNEIELSQLYEAVCGYKVSATPHVMLSSLLEKAKNLKMIWMHSRVANTCLWKKEFLPVEIVEKAQMFASVAGAIRVETGKYPEKESVLKRIKKIDFYDDGIEYIKKSSKASDEICSDYYINTVPSIKSNGFETEVGAGDTACAAFTYMLSSLTAPDTGAARG